MLLLREEQLYGEQPSEEQLPHDAQLPHDETQIQMIMYLVDHCSLCVKEAHLLPPIAKRRLRLTYLDNHADRFAWVLFFLLHHIHQQLLRISRHKEIWIFYSLSITRCIFNQIW